MMLRFSNGQKNNKTFLYIFLHKPSPVIKGSLVINSKYPISNYNFIISISNSIFICLYILHKYKFLFINWIKKKKILLKGNFLQKELIKK